MGFMDPAIQCVLPGRRVAGTAVTLALPGQDSTLLHHAIALLRPGDFLCIDRLGVDVELRDIFQHPEHRAALIDARGRATVPVLRITSTDGEDRWMPESRDIVRFLEKTYA